MRNNLLRKYFFAATALIMISVIVLGGAMGWQGYKYSIKEKRQMLENKAVQIAGLTTDLLRNYSALRENSFKFILSSVTEGGMVHVLISSTDGQIVMTSDDTTRAYNGSYINESIIKKLAESGYYSGVGSLGGLYKGSNYTVAVPAENSLGQYAGYVFVTAPMSSMRELLYDILRMFILSAITVLLLAAMIAYLAVRGMTRPIKGISSAAKSFAQGEFNTRVPVTRSDEIGEMQLAFNNMADSLERSEELRRSFVANVSHELRSPMTSIGGFVDGILDGTIPEERREHYLRIISGEVKRLSRLVSRMLDITRLQAKDVSADSAWFDMCELIRRVIVGFEERMKEKELDMDVALCAYSVNICANEDMIYQAVYNLTENAIKFSKPQSKISIALSVRGGKVYFSIQNRGETIPPDELCCVFDRFHKTDRSRGNDKTGLGLGLYIVKTIVNQHRGDVGVKSHEGLTEFSFTLPVECRAKRGAETSNSAELTKHS